MERRINENYFLCKPRQCLITHLNKHEKWRVSLTFQLLQCKLTRVTFTFLMAIYMPRKVKVVTTRLLHEYHYSFPLIYEFNFLTAWYLLALKNTRYFFLLLFFCLFGFLHGVVSIKPNCKFLLSVFSQIVCFLAQI